MPVSKVEQAEWPEVGMHYVLAMKRDGYDKYFSPRDRLVGWFGIVDDEGNEILVGWKVNGYRKDKRHGPVERPKGWSPYGKSLLDSAFKNW